MTPHCYPSGALGYLYTGLGVWCILFAESTFVDSFTLPLHRTQSPTQVILEMRVYALYQKSSRILALMIILSTFSLGVDFIQGFRITCVSCLDRNESICRHSRTIDLATDAICIGNCHQEDPYFVSAVQQRFITGFSCTANSVPISAIGWLVTVLVELILFAMVLRTARKHEQGGFTAPLTAKRDLTTIIANDSRIYFAVYVLGCGLDK